jgi:uncharacterized protein YndB with AHSA1/START domain
MDLTRDAAMTREIKQQVVFNAPPARVFSALMDSKQHSRFTGEPAKISRLPGGRFTCYGGYITGINLEIKPSGLIVQAWHSGSWPKETWSVIVINLTRIAGNKTKLSFNQTGVPANDYKEKYNGWRTHYWERLKKYLERRTGAKKTV